MALEASGTLTGIHRFAIKGLSGDRLKFAELLERGGLPHDRRFAFIFLRSAHLLKEHAWLHKENFVSVFSSAEVTSGLETDFDDGTCVLTVWRRGERDSKPPLLEVGMESADGRRAASAFFSDAVGEPVELVDGAETHQFGNTAKGLKASGDLRTLHVVNANTVRALAEAAGVPIDPRRFRPNLLIEGVPAWAEFGWVGKDIRVGPKAELRVIGRTVRCSGVNRTAEVAGGTDGDAPTDTGGELDVPALLNTHFPEHGPYLGVYAQCTRSGGIRIGDQLRVKEPPSPPRWAMKVRQLLTRAGVPGQLISCENPTVGVLCFGFVLAAAVAHIVWWLGGR